MKHFIAAHFIALLLVVPATVISLLALCFGKTNEKAIGLMGILVILAFALFPFVDSALSHLGINRETSLLITMACLLVFSLIPKKTNKSN
jgi:hypothetical protein